MIKPRFNLLKSRYFILFIIVCLLLWQITVKYPAYLSQTNHESSSDSFITNIKNQANKSRVMVSVYYEALCPDSRSFFVRHLLPTFEKMNTGLEVELIPYGKAEMKEVKNGRLKFSCQHGPIECLANKIHSCAIHNIEDPLLLMKFVTCLINDFEDPENAGSMCAEKYKVPWKLISNCARGVEGDWFLKKYGELTVKLEPRMTFVPTILLNQKHHRQTLILKNLEKELCSIYADVLAKECKK